MFDLLLHFSCRGWRLVTHVIRLHSDSDEDLQTRTNLRCLCSTWLSMHASRNNTKRGPRGGFSLRR